MNSATFPSRRPELVIFPVDSRRPVLREEEADRNEPREAVKPPNREQDLERRDGHGEEAQFGQAGDEKTQADDVPEAAGDESEKRQGVGERHIGGDLGVAQNPAQQSRELEKTVALMPSENPMPGPGTRTPRRS
ncbi:hypothetical protein QMG52_05195 [Paenarthrobacter sp. PH39-S1]|nr:hypothetical protein [Paenarthrobacter sp. PH39-S1]